MKVLVVDDSAAYRRVLERAVRSLGHECLVAEDGLRAWEAFEAEGAEVVISNWLMPGIDGDELCRRVRSSPRPYAYFILFTALEGRNNVMHGMEAGADDYLAKPLNEEELEACLIAADRVAGLHRRLAEQQRELERLNRELYDQSREDALTGLGNRLRLREDLESAEANAERYGRRYAVALCDVDRFKAYNDGAGHLAGDEVLRSVAEALRQSLRKGDVMYRFGGEELLAVMADQDEELAGIVAERLRRAVERLSIPHPVGDLDVVTVSVGVAVRDGDYEGGIERLLGEADQALYQAKSEGRNRVVVHKRRTMASPVDQ